MMDEQLMLLQSVIFLPILLLQGQIIHKLQIATFGIYIDIYDIYIYPISPPIYIHFG